MLGVFTKLLHILTMGPFSPQTGVWTRLGLGLNAESPGLGKHDGNLSAASLSSSSTWSVSTVQEPNINTGQNFSLSLTGQRKTLRDNTNGQGFTPAQDLLLLLTGAIISGFFLSFSERETIVFLLGFANVAYWTGVAVSLYILYLGQIAPEPENMSLNQILNQNTTELLISLRELIESLKSIGSSMVMTSVVAKVYFTIFPHPLSRPPPLILTLPAKTPGTMMPPLDDSFPRQPLISAKVGREQAAPPLYKKQ